jgi:hypothetical protein
VTDVPRRLRPTQAERLKTRLNATPGLAEGQSRTLRPVQPRGGASRSQQPVSQTDRLIVNWTNTLAGGTVASFFTGSNYNITSWPYIVDSSGSSVGLNPAGDDGGIYLFEPGVYACNIILEAADIGNAASNCVIRFQFQTWDVPGIVVQGAVIDVGSRGGDGPYPAGAPSPGTSFVFYSDGGGVDGGGLSFNFQIAHLDPAVTFVWVIASVQRLS